MLKSAIFRRMCLTKGSECYTYSVMDTTFIYVLKDPETGLIRYVGKSNSPKTRLRRHLMDGRCKNGHRALWIKSLAERGIKPALEIVDEVSMSEWQSAEAAYIEFFREQGCDLVNNTFGGDGVSLFGEKNPNFGKPLPAETRRKISERRLALKIPGYWKGKKLPPEAREKISIAASERLGEKNGFFGRAHSPETCEHLRAVLVGKKHKKARSLFRGVSWSATPGYDGSIGKWRATINTPGKRIFIGNFSNELDAAQAYDAAAKKYHGAHAVLNFPD